MQHQSVAAEASLVPQRDIRVIFLAKLGSPPLKLSELTRLIIMIYALGIGIPVMLKSSPSLHEGDYRGEISLTEQYLAVDGRQAMKNLVDFHKKHSPYPTDDTSPNERIRRKLLDILGTQKCTICGETEIKILDFDHIQGGGNIEVRKLGSNKQMLLFYIKNPEIAKVRLQVLCSKHNRIKKIENKEFSRLE